MRTIPNIDAHQSRLLPPVRIRRYTEAKKAPAQNCYLATASLRPRPPGLEPAVGTCHTQFAGRVMADTILAKKARLDC